MAQVRKRFQAIKATAKRSMPVKEQTRREGIGSEEAARNIWGVKKSGRGRKGERMQWLERNRQYQHRGGTFGGGTKTALRIPPALRTGTA